MTSSAPVDAARWEPPPISRGLTFMLALACGAGAANIYYVQPLVGLIGRDYAMPLSSTGILVTVTQIGYATGLVLVVPLGDIVENRRLILVLMGVLVATLVGAALAPTAGVFLLASLCIGLAASAVQIIVPFAGHLAPDASRGRIVGNVVSGLLFGVMLSRPLASFAAHFVSTRAIFWISAAVTAALLVPLGRALPMRRPHGLPYLQALRSLGPLLANTTVLHRRGIIQAALFATFSLFWTAVPLLLEGPMFGFSQVGIGFFALLGATGAIVSPYAGRAADRGHARLIMILALSSCVAGCLAALAGGALRSWPLLVLAALLLDGAAAAHLIVGQRAIFAVGADVRGRLNGLYLALFFLGGAVGSLVSGYAFAFAGWAAVSLVGLVFPVAALVYVAAVERRTGVPLD